MTAVASPSAAAPSGVAPASTNASKPTSTSGKTAAGVKVPLPAVVAPAVASQRRQLPLPLIIGGLAGCAGLGVGLASLMLLVARRRRGQNSGGKGGAAAGAKGTVAGPCAKLKPTSRCVPLADGSGCVIRREIAADNSCLFNSVGYAMHKSKTRAPHLRNVVAQQVSGDRTTYSDAFLGMTNEAYCNWIRQPFNWGGGIELSILAQAYGIEIAAWNIESCKEHVFGEESGYKRQVMVIYNGVHYDALAVCSSPRANPDEDETSLNPRTKRGKLIIAAARKLVELAHKESQFHCANKKAPAASASAASAASSASSSSTPKPKAKAKTNANANGGSGSGASASKDDAAVDGGATTVVPGAAARLGARNSSKAAAATAGDTAASGPAIRLSCGDCGEVMTSRAAAAQHAKLTGHQNYHE